MNDLQKQLQCQSSDKTHALCHAKTNWGVKRKERKKDICKAHKKH